MKRVLVVGAGPYQIPIIQRMMELGIEVFCVDKNSNAPGYAYAAGHRDIDVLDAQACLAYARELDIDGVTTYGATLTLPTVCYIGRALSLPVLPLETAEAARNKFTIKQILADAGCNIKGSFFQMHSVEDGTKHQFSLPCVIKPSDGSGSKGVSMVFQESDLEAAIEYACASARFGSFYAESFIPGEEYTVETFVNDGEVHVYAVVKTTFRREVDGSICYGHRTPSGLQPGQEASIAEEVTKAVRALNITMGSANFDVILSDEDGKPYIIDCGIRIGQNLIASHLVPLSRGVSILDNTIAQALRMPVDARPKTWNYVATRLLIYEPGVITRVKPMDDVIGTQGILDVVMRKSVGDVLKPYKEKSDTCGWVIAGGESPDEAEAYAQAAKDRLKSYIIIEPMEG